MDITKDRGRHLLVRSHPNHNLNTCLSKSDPTADPTLHLNESILEAPLLLNNNFLLGLLNSGITLELAQR